MFLPPSPQRVLESRTFISVVVFVVVIVVFVVVVVIV